MEMIIFPALSISFRPVKQKTHSLRVGRIFFSAESAYRNAPRHLVGRTAKSKPIRVGDANHGNSVFRLFPVHKQILSANRAAAKFHATLRKTAPQCDSARIPMPHSRG